MFLLRGGRWFSGPICLPVLSTTAPCATDEDSRIAGYKVTLLNYLLVALTAVVVVLSLRIVGGLLISAVLVIPVITASRFAKAIAQSLGRYRLHLLQ